MGWMDLFKFSKYVQRTVTEVREVTVKKSKRVKVYLSPLGYEPEGTAFLNWLMVLGLIAGLIWLCSQAPLPTQPW